MVILWTAVFTCVGDHAARAGTVALQFENDILGLRESDWHYTNGLQLSWQSDPDGLPRWLDGWVRGRGLFPAGGVSHLRVALGQNLFTPQDIKTTELVPDDRPYAAWLHADFDVVSYREQTLTLLEVSVGVVGPSAGGKFLQDRFHNLIDSPIPQGWEHQLHDELALLVGYGRKWRNFGDPGRMTVPGLPGLEFQVNPQVDVAVGNVLTYAATGFNLRLGQGLGGTFCPIRLRPGGTGTLAVTDAHTWSWGLFAGCEGRWVLHNIFLDGNTFGNSHSVERKPLVGDAWLGWDVSWRGMRVALHYVNRSREFVGQETPDHFGAMTFSVGY